ncbi:VWA domain-containing protein [bacterium]|nr:VWA domain-containing protein [bacterium]
MKDQLLGFFDALRQAGLAPSVGETLDAAAAVRAAGIERPVLREALAAALIKDHAERATFDDVFDRYFALPPAAARARRPSMPRQGDEGSGRGGEGAGRGQPRQEGAAGQQPREEPRRGHDQRARELARRRALAAKPFREMEPDEVEGLDDLVAELGRRLRSRFARRQRRVRGGRVDMRRTIRRALARGGVPVEILFRAPRPGRSDLLALVDVSHSTATAAEFLLALLAPARRHFRRVTLLAYVDRPCPVSFEAGQVVPHEALDLNARSDFGNVLKLLAERWDVAIGRNTVLLILGDARNNRRPPRADLLARLRRVARRIIWLNPEPVARWNTGDSVMATYARHSDAVLAAWSPATLAAALGELPRH